jgi:hypothetical protein
MDHVGEYKAFENLIFIPSVAIYRAETVFAITDTNEMRAIVHLTHLTQWAFRMRTLPNGVRPDPLLIKAVQSGVVTTFSRRSMHLYL